MKNPWSHDEVPEISSRPSTGMRLLSLVVWGSLLLTLVGLLAFSARGMISTDSIGPLLTVLSVLFIIAVSIPILKKLLAISRLLVAVALLLNIWLILRVMSFQDVQWAQTLLDGQPVDAAFELIPDTLELFAVVPF